VVGIFLDECSSITAIITSHACHNLSNAFIVKRLNQGLVIDLGSSIECDPFHSLWILLCRENNVVDLSSSLEETNIAKFCHSQHSYSCLNVTQALSVVSGELLSDTDERLLPNIGPECFGVWHFRISKFDFSRCVHIFLIIVLAHLDENLGKTSKGRNSATLDFIEALIALFVFSMTLTHHVLRVIVCVPVDAFGFHRLWCQAITSRLEHIEEHGEVVAGLVEGLLSFLRRLFIVTTVNGDIIESEAFCSFGCDLCKFRSEQRVHLSLIVHVDFNIVLLCGQLDFHQLS